MTAMTPTPPLPADPVRAGLKQARDRQRQGDISGALRFYHQVLSADPHCAEALQEAGILHAGQGDLAAARDLLAAACRVRPGAAAYFNLAKVLQGLRRRDEALTAYQRALIFKPDFPEACNNLGNVLKDLQRYDQAIASYDRALILRPDYGKALINRGATLTLLRRHQEALADCNRLLALQPEAAGAYNNRAILLGQLNRHELALADYQRVTALAPEFPYARGGRLHTQLRIGLWDDFDRRVADLLAALAQGCPARPFSLLGLPVPPALLQRNAARYAADNFPPAPQPLWQGEDYDHARLRLGYFSADFHEHATAYLTAGLFEHHDRARFEVYAYSFGPPQRDAMRARLENGFDRFFELAGHSDGDIAALARRHQIDIAVDLKGYTLDCRPGVFARRPAPLQINYLGFPGTLGVSYMDYIIADPVVIPEAHFSFYSEKVAHLPHSYQVNDDRRAIAAFTPPRPALGLPEDGFVFCCFNNTFKITPDVFGLWMRLLAEVKGSVLWLLEDHPAVRFNLAREAARHDIDPVRLIFAPRLPAAEHLARLRRADLFLDTFHYNAHTTASDALWAGLPVITRLGGHFAGRVAASLLQAVGLPEMITRTRDEYFALARRLVTHSDRLAAIKNKLAAQRLRAPLFDTARFTRDLEALFLALWQRHRRGLPPAHFRG
jgi:predicted O-linked N-acetylglucosamine transferase (SPINDLY family)